MKSLRISNRSLMVALLASTSLAQANPGTTVIKPRPDSATIAALRASGPSVNGTKLEGRQPAAERKSQAASFLKSSTLLAFNGNWTLVPKHAVIHIPESLQSRIVTQPSGKLLSWREFLTLNRGWIHLQNVTLSDARGETAVSPAALKASRATGRVVVAVCEGGPISMPAHTLAKN